MNKLTTLRERSLFITGGGGEGGGAGKKGVDHENIKKKLRNQEKDYRKNIGIGGGGSKIIGRFIINLASSFLYFILV